METIDYLTSLYLYPLSDEELAVMSTNELDNRLDIASREKQSISTYLRKKKLPASVKEVKNAELKTAKMLVEALTMFSSDPSIKEQGFVD